MHTHGPLILFFFFFKVKYYAKKYCWGFHEENIEVSISAIYATAEGGETGNYSFYQFCYFPKYFVTFRERHDLPASVSTG